MKIKHKDKIYEYDYKSICLPNNVHEKLKELAIKNKTTIAKFLKQEFLK